MPMVSFLCLFFSSCFRSEEPTDAYVVIKAYTQDSTVVVKKTATKMNTLDPVWNVNFNLGANDWSYFTIQVWDFDGDESYTNSKGIEITMQDQSVSGLKTVSLSSKGTFNNVKYTIGAGGLYYDYSFL